jgi:glycosyltransferase involved in cell wall biosynthesis
MGRPVIATDHGGAREILLDDETGWLVPPNDPQALADAIAKALDLPASKRLTLAERSIARMRANFTTKAMTDRTLAVYDEVLFPETATPPGAVARSR